MLETERKKPRVLIVDDDRNHLKMMRAVLTEDKYEIVFACNLSEANKIVLEALQTGDRFQVALVDLIIGQECGDEFAHRLLNIVGDIKVVIVSGNYDIAADLTFDVDGILVKTAEWFHNPETLVEKLEEVLLLERKSRHSIANQINRWIATGLMGTGILDLTNMTMEVKGDKGKHERLEKLICHRRSDKLFTATVIYPEHPGDKVVPISLHSTMGCTQRCKMCVHWHSHVDKKTGKTVPYIGPLSANEIVSQVYHAFNNSSRLLDLCEGGRPEIVKANFTGEGDVLCDNLDNAAEAMWRLSNILYPQIHFTVTSVGRADRLRHYLDKYVGIPRVTLYWSANSVNPEKRDWLMPASKGQSLEELRDLYQEIERVTGQPVTVSFALFPGVNDQDDDVVRIADFLRNWPDVHIKLMPGCPDTLSGHRNITIAEVKAFQHKLYAAGLRHVRFRKIYGTSEYAGCGTTQPVFLVGLSKLRRN